MVVWVLRVIEEWSEVTVGSVDYFIVYRIVCNRVQRRSYRCLTGLNTRTDMPTIGLEPRMTMSWAVHFKEVETNETY